MMFSLPGSVVSILELFWEFYVLGSGVLLLGVWNSPFGDLMFFLVFVLLFGVCCFPFSGLIFCCLRCDFLLFWVWWSPVWSGMFFFLGSDCLLLCVLYLIIKPWPGQLVLLWLFWVYFVWKKLIQSLGDRPLKADTNHIHEDIITVHGLWAQKSLKVTSCILFHNDGHQQGYLVPCVVSLVWFSQRMILDNQPWSCGWNCKSCVGLRTAEWTTLDLRWTFCNCQAEISRNERLCVLLQ